jgi:hypothetical protein
MKKGEGGQVRTVRVASDEVESQGPGTWVELRQSLKLKHLRALTDLSKLQGIDRMDLEAVNKGFDAVCEALSRFVVAWNWRDEDGEPLPSPKRDPEAFSELEFDELMWLIGRVTAMVGELVSKKR